MSVVWPGPSAVLQKLAQHWKSTILLKKSKKTEKRKSSNRLTPRIAYLQKIMVCDVWIGAGGVRSSIFHRVALRMRCDDICKGSI